MNSFNDLPGSDVFMKFSPMRKPRNPAERRVLTVSGFEMPLSLTLTASFGRSSAKRNEFSTSVTNDPRLRLLMPHTSGSSSAYSSSASECISSSTSSPNACALSINCLHSCFERQAAISRTADAPQSAAAYSCASLITKFL